MANFDTEKPTMSNQPSKRNPILFLRPYFNTTEIIKLCFVECKYERNIKATKRLNSQLILRIILESSSLPTAENQRQLISKLERNIGEC